MIAHLYYVFAMVLSLIQKRNDINTNKING